MTNNRKHIVIICRQPPYGSSLSKEALDFSLAAGVFGQQISMAFIGDGVWQLLDQQNSELLAMKNQQKMLSALALYDIDKIYVDHEALTTRNIALKQLAITVKPLVAEEIKNLLASADVILNF